jgi:hypothetical protein
MSVTNQLPFDNTLLPHFYDAMTFSITTLDITTLSIMRVSIKGLFWTLSINGIQLNDTHPVSNVVMLIGVILSVAIFIGMLNLVATIL